MNLASFLGKFLLCFSFLFAANLHANEVGPTVEEKQEKEDDIMDWVMEEVVPAFDGFNNLQFLSVPTVDFVFNRESFAIASCAAEVSVEQLKTITYQFLKIPTYVDGTADIGANRRIHFAAKCGEDNFKAGVSHFKVRVYFTENGELATYNLVYHILDQSQKLLQMKYIDLEIRITQGEFPLLLSLSNEKVDYLPEYEKFRDGDSYNLPMSLWKEKSSSGYSVPSEDAGLTEIPTQKLVTNKKMDVHMKMESLFPIGNKAGEHIYTDYYFCFTGSQYSNEEDGSFPFFRARLTEKNCNKKKEE